MSADPAAATVTVIGAGPTGLALACELAAAGVHCRVLEKRPRRVAWSRAMGLEPRTLEMFDMRGMAEPFVDRGRPWRLQPLGDRAHHLDYALLDTSFPYVLILSQHHTEELLEKRAVELGAEIVRDAELTGLTQDDTGVTLEVRGPDRRRTERAAYVVGCDGVRSRVRELSGIGFTGRSYRESLVVADVRLTAPPAALVDARIAPRGLVAVFPLDDGVFRLVVLDRDRMRLPVEQPVTPEELTDSVLAVFGEDLGVGEVVWASRFRSDQRLADRYREGRVLLAGDAAHTHLPSGGQGLQMGIQDAFNLGWKLAAEVQGRAPAALLDSYEAERAPVARRVLRQTDRAFRFETSRSALANAARWAGMRLMRVRPLQRPLIDDLAGLTLRYRPASGATTGRMTGRRLPDTPLYGAGPSVTRLYEQLRDQCFLLVDQSPDGRAAAVAEHWAGPVRTVRAVAGGRRRWPAALLVRPDGHVAWSGDGARPEGLRDALHTWVGEAPQRPEPRLPERTMDDAMEETA
ncbi:NAD(P)-binding protein [Streptomyces sp. SID89]|nr:NAD(P)-binding protein [Streptomyces sp. SID89]